MQTPENRSPQGALRTRLAVFALIAMIPFLAHWIYAAITAWPDRVVIASGTSGGRYDEIGRAVGEILNDLGIETEVRQTEGSMQNLSLLQSGEVDFGLYQPGTAELLDRPLESSDSENGIAFVATLYSQPVHVIVHNDSKVDTIHNLRNKRIGVGLEESGNYAIAKTLLRYAGLDNKSVELFHANYDETSKALLEHKIDAVILTMGSTAPFFPSLFNSGQVKLIGVPFAEALTHHLLFLDQYTIPPSWCHLSPPVPEQPIDTVSIPAQLLARSDLPDGLIEEVARRLHEQRFVRKNQLRELSEHGTAFSRNEASTNSIPGRSPSTNRNCAHSSTRTSSMRPKAFDRFSCRSVSRRSCFGAGIATVRSGCRNIAWTDTSTNSSDSNGHRSESSPLSRIGSQDTRTPTGRSGATAPGRDGGLHGARPQGRPRYRLLLGDVPLPIAEDRQSAHPSEARRYGRADRQVRLITALRERSIKGSYATAQRRTCRPSVSPRE